MPSSDKYSKILKDQRFKKGRIKIAHKSKHLKKLDLLDDRFNDIINNEKYNKNSKTVIDERGKKLDKSKTQVETFYDVEFDEEKDQTQEIEDVQIQEFQDRARGGGDNDEGSTTEEDSEFETEEQMEKMEKDFVSITDKFESETQKYQHVVYELTNRLAFVNLDWGKVNARDLHILCNSFKEMEGNVISVKIYKSEAGKKAEKEGLILPKASGSNNDNKPDMDREKIREFELSKLRWRYAIVEISDQNSAEKIYNECDGQEYMSSGLLMNISFVDESTTFDDNDLVDSFPEKSGVSGKDTEDQSQHTRNDEYHPLNLTHSLTSHTAIKSTFDEDDVRRRNLFHEMFENYTEEDYYKDGDEFDDSKFNAMIASSDSESDNEENGTSKSERREMYRKMLLEIDENENNKENDSNDQVHKTITIEIDPDRDPDAFSDNQSEGDEENDQNEMEEDGSSNSDDDVDDDESAKSDAEDFIISENDENKKAQTEMMIGSDLESESEDDDVNNQKTTIIKPSDLTSDDRFGSNLGLAKFSIDRTSKSYKESDNMTKLMEFQVEYRRKKREQRVEIQSSKRKNDSKQGRKVIEEKEDEDDSERLLAKLSKRSKK